MYQTIPKFSRAAVDRAARTLISDSNTHEQTDAAWEVLGNWRGAHAFPLNTVTVDLKQKVNREEIPALVVQRLKRSRSILAKLGKEPSMRLTQMQDIGGCRAVVPTIADVYSLRDRYRQSRSLHELVAEDDYIASPKGSGYRGVHLVYRFRSRSRPEFNRLLLEVQLRSLTQHAWATAVETVGAIVGQALKSSEGELAWLRYFQLASLALEYAEQPAFVRDMPLSRGSVARSLTELEKKLDVRKKLAAYRTALRATEHPKAKDARYFLLVLLPEEPGLQIFAFNRDQSELAQAEYQRYERQLPLRSKQLSLFPDLADYSGAQVVLVGAESMRSIKAAFPNYYLDTGDFLAKTENFVHRFKRAP